MDPDVVLLLLILGCSDDCFSGLLDSGASFNPKLPRDHFKASTNWGSGVVPRFNPCNPGTVFKVLIFTFQPLTG